MDILFFFSERTRFVRRFYAAASSVFQNEMDRIENGVPPYDNPPYEECGEPAYMNEWREAKEGLDVVGLMCISMLSESVNAFFLAWETALGVRWENGERRGLFREYGVKGYVDCVGELVGTPSDCPADLEVVEQVILARNAAQHPDDLSQLVPKHRKSDLSKHRRPFFMDEFESLYLEGDLADVFFLVPRVRVSRKKLFLAIEEAEKLTQWLDELRKTSPKTR